MKRHGYSILSDGRDQPEDGSTLLTSSPPSADGYRLRGTPEKSGALGNGRVLRTN